MGKIDLDSIYAIASVVFIYVIAIARVCHIMRKERRNRENSSAGLDRGVNEGLPTFECRLFDGFVKEGQECVVCLSEFADSEIVKLLPNCCHYFHKECIEIWFLSHSSCPVCRTRVHPDPSSIL
ncbi:hypothetical protein SUGI_0654200 [Cryptomeria japonica]|nr:hypothetical protein SUGI_0654200 [Cryptomeria japonica]